MISIQAFILYKIIENWYLNKAHNLLSIKNFFCGKIIQMKVNDFSKLFYIMYHYQNLLSTWRIFDRNIQIINLFNEKETEL